MSSTKADRPLQSSSLAHWQAAMPMWTARILQAAAVWALIARLVGIAVPSLRGFFTTFFTLLNLPGTFSFFNAILLFILAEATRHRRRVAMWIIILYFQVSTIVYAVVVLFLAMFHADGLADSGFAQETHYIGHVGLVFALLFAVASSILLYKSREAFPSRVDRGSWWRATTVAAIGIAVAIGIGSLLMWIFHPHVSVGYRLALVVGSAFGQISTAIPTHGVHLFAPAIQPGHSVTISIIVSLIAGAGLFIAFFFVFLRSSRKVLFTNADDELRVRRLLLQQGRHDSLGYFATRRDKSITFSANGKAAIAYRLVGSIILAGGDPIGERSSWDGAIEAWLNLARRYGWTPAVLGVTPTGAAAYTRHGLRSLAFGDEAVIIVNDFSLSSPRMRAVHSTYQHVAREKYSISIRRQGDIPAEELADIMRKANEWRHGDNERGFSMQLGRFGDPTDSQSIIVVASDSEGAMRGLLTFVPWGQHSISLDLMRRSPHAANGVTTYMIASVVEACHDMGIREVALNFAVLRRVFEVGEQIGAFPLQRFTRRMVLFLSRWWQLESLYRSNEKYLPEWRPRLVCYDAGAPILEVLIAAGKAEGFIPEGPFSRFSDSFARRAPRRGEATRVRISPDRSEERSFVDAVHADEAAARENTRMVRPHVSHEVKMRYAAMDDLRRRGIAPYAHPLTFAPTQTIAAICGRFMHVTPDFHSGEGVWICGRVMRIRDHGGLIFADLRDGKDEVQVMLSRESVDTTALHAHAPETFDAWRRCVDRGDIVCVHGAVMATHTGQLTVDAVGWNMATKSLLPMPDKRLGITDPEAKLRHREIDLATSTSAYTLLEHRFAINKAVREFFFARDYTEVETPMLQAIHGGANARPFTTRSNAYGMELSLRIAPELALKKLLVAGYDKIFEMGRSFRNEGADVKHNPEFTSIEAYQWFTDEEWWRNLTRELIIETAIAVHGKPIAIRPDGTELDISGPWESVTYHDAVSRAIGKTVTPDTPADEIIAICHACGVETSASATAGENVMELYDRFVEGQTDHPTFFMRPPLEVAPLCCPYSGDTRLVEKWDLVVFGMEIGTGETDITDAIDQRERFTAQSLKAAAGDAEAMEIDENFLHAIEFGMPPLGGWGLGMDRLAMILTGSGIRQTLAFPFVRPR